MALTYFFCNHRIVLLIKLDGALSLSSLKSSSRILSHFLAIVVRQ
ncbi:hypothetical protein VIBNIMADA3021_340015 [Vibrio nigripulchritudo MADA3021]|nr:hypothetical protein VIBNIMADA3021_340015 [Vibrio nigripulchritudo MADA3021]